MFLNFYVTKVDDTDFKTHVVFNASSKDKISHSTMYFWLDQSSKKTLILSFICFVYICTLFVVIPSTRHMERVHNFDSLISSTRYFFPYFYVTKVDNIDGKIHVVFNASLKEKISLSQKYFWLDQSSKQTLVMSSICLAYISTLFVVISEKFFVKLWLLPYSLSV